jgi:hypothetical protein
MTFNIMAALVVASVFGSVAVGALVALGRPADPGDLPVIGQRLRAQCYPPPNSVISIRVYRAVLGVSAVVVLAFTQCLMFAIVADSSIAQGVGPGRLVAVGAAELFLLAWTAYVVSMFRRAPRP